MTTQQPTKKGLKDWFPIAEQEVALLYPVVSLSDLQDELWQMLASVYEDLDAIAEQQRRETGPWCEDNCGRCCLEAPVVSLMECSLVVMYLQDLPNGQMRSMVHRVNNWLRQPPRSEEKRQAGKCPFLDPAHRCSIYSVRPFTCRAYGVIQGMDCFCPAWRKAQKEGGHPIIVGEAVDSLYLHMAKILALIKRHIPANDHAMFLPAGVALILNGGSLLPQETEALGWDKRKLIYFPTLPATSFNLPGQ